jgi:hypothetical protein
MVRGRPKSLGTDRSDLLEIHHVGGRFFRHVVRDSTVA